MTRGRGGARSAHHVGPGRRWLAAAILAVWTVSTLVAASESPSGGEFRRLEGGGSSFARLATEVSRVSAGEPSLVVVGPVRSGTDSGSDVAGKTTQKLWAALRTRVAAVVPLTKVLSEEALAPQDARRQARSQQLPLVYLNPQLSGGTLNLDVSVTKWQRGFWRRSLHPFGSITSRYRLEVKADSAIRGLFPQPKEFMGSSESFPSPMAAPLAIACGDLGEDGVVDVALFDRREIIVGHPEGARFVVTARQLWSQLTAVSPTPLRAPLGALRMNEDSLDVGLSDRAHLLRLSSALQPLMVGPRAYPLSEGTCADFTATGIDDNPADCALQEKASSLVLSQTPKTNAGYDALSAISLTTSDGSELKIRATLAHGSSTAQVEILSTTEGTRSLNLPGTGAILLWVDLNGDGKPELLSSSATREGSTDELRLHGYGSGRLLPLASIKDGHVHAVGVCPFRGENPLQVAAVIGKELRLIQ